LNAASSSSTPTHTISSTVSKTPLIKKLENGNTYEVLSNYEACTKVSFLDSFSKNTALFSRFSDIYDSPYETDIIALEKAGVIHGDTNGLFHPKRFVTRAEFLKMLLKTHCI
jgi:hypothetical protein